MRKILFSIVAVLIALLAVTAFTQDEETFSITIMHTNDTHAHHEPNSDGYGGVARQATVVKQIRAEVENSLLLSAGDRFNGTLFHTVHVGMDQVPIMNTLGYDAMTLGNHEFNHGDQVLADVLSGFEFPIVVANIDFSNSPLAAVGIEPHIVLDVNGHQIGIIGLDTVDTLEISSPGDGLVWREDYAAVVNEQVAELEAQGVNKIILLTHLGINADFAMITELEGVDLVIGGHSHTLYSNTYRGREGNYPIEFETTSGETVYYVQAGEYNEHLGRADIEFDAEGNITDFEGDTIRLVQYIEPDAELQAIVDQLAAPIEELRNFAVGEAGVFLVGDRTVCRVEECNLGNLITDAIRAETGAQIGLQNGGGIRADIEAGDVTYGEILTVLPFGNLVSTLELTGADVIVALENGVSEIALTEDGLIQRGGAAGRFPQVSGISYTYDPTLEPGSRIVEVLLEDGTPLDPAATYTVATNDFMRGGGDGYDVLDENAINPYDFGKPLDEVVADYINANGPVAPEVEGRITSTVEVEPASE
jgi:5'-nucleotidase/UDP-sugar diphosphatase